MNIYHERSVGIDDGQMDGNSGVYSVDLSQVSSKTELLINRSVKIPDQKVSNMSHKAQDAANQHYRMLKLNKICEMRVSLATSHRLCARASRSLRSSCDDQITICRRVCTLSVVHIVHYIWIHVKGGICFSLLYYQWNFNSLPFFGAHDEWWDS